MAEILLCSQPVGTDHLEKQFGVPENAIHGLNSPTTSTLRAYQPYLLGEAPTMIDRCVLSNLGSPAYLRNLTELSLSLGPDKLSTLAELFDRLHKEKIHEKREEENHPVEFGIAAFDRTAALIEKRGQNLANAANAYKKSLLDYRSAIKSKNPSAGALAKLKAKAAFDNLQVNYRTEMKMLAVRSASRRGTAFDSFERATNIAKSSRNVAKLNIVNQIEASKLGRLAKYSKVLGNGLTVLDFGMGANKIRTSYQKGGNWEREMFIESSAFASSAIIAGAAADVGALLLIATPVGWVGLLISGVIVAGTVGVSAMVAANAKEKLESNGGGYYDKIMGWLANK